MKFRVEGKNVVTDNGVVRSKGSKSAAKATAGKLNERHAAKMKGYVVQHPHSYRPSV